MSLLNFFGKMLVADNNTERLFVPLTLKTVSFRGRE
jgi:hypothetical protein